MLEQTLSKPILPSQSPLVYLSTQFIQAKEYLEAIVASTSDAICTTDLEGRIIYFSPGAEKMFGRPAGAALGRTAHSFYAGGKSEARSMMRTLLKSGNLSDRELVVVKPGGERIHISMSAALLKDRNRKVIGTLGISKDITHRVELERRLRELSITDNLTGLYNQRHFMDRLSTEIQRAQRQRQKLSILMIDLDHFKQANDLWGHVEGDRILKQTADIIRACVRKGVDDGFRYGGDEFTALLPGLGPSTASKVAARIRDAAARKPYARLVSLSIGQASLRPKDALPQLIKRADSHMYKVKLSHRRRRGA